MTTVGDIYNLIDSIAPFAQAEEWDNVGLLAGSVKSPAERVLCALELNSAVLNEAVENGTQLIVTHHPIMFRGRKNLREDDAEGRLLCELIRANISLIAAHTNFDTAACGVNDALAQTLELSDVTSVEGYMRIGTTRFETLGEFSAFAEDVLGGPIRRYGDRNRKIHRVAVLGGAGAEYADAARENGADVFVTGEIGHHRAYGACEEGLCVLEAGHAATELPSISLLVNGLQNAANAVQYSMEILLSRTELFK